MEWLISLFADNSTIAHDVVVYALVIAFGVLLGKIKFFGVSLGVTFVLFVGILAGHIGFNIGNMMLLNFLRDFGLILFVFSIGMQVGPGFFSSFKKDGMQMNLIAALTILLNVVVAVAIKFIDSSLTVPQMVGILSGAVTNTPGLGAAQQALETLGQSGADDLSMGYAAAYPLGVIGIILSMILLKVFCKIKVEDEAKVIEEEKENNQLKPYVVTFKVENSLLNGKTVRELNSIVEHHFVISRLRKTDGEVIIPTSKTVLNSGDLLLIVCSAQDEDIFHSVIGSTVEYEWGALAQGEVVSRRILVTNSHYNGRTLGSLRLHNGYRLNATRVNRAGIDLTAGPGLHLQLGDRIMVVGAQSAIDKVANLVGNQVRKLREPKLIPIFIGIFFGIIVGSIPIMLPGLSQPLKLGLAGGSLVVAILIARFGPNFGMVTYTTASSNMMLREVGITLFLAAVGLGAGQGFVEALVGGGYMWILYGFLITVIPLIIVCTLARLVFKLDYYSISGLVCGSHTNPTALAFMNSTFDESRIAVAYATVYPLSMFLRVIVAQLMVL